MLKLFIIGILTMLKSQIPTSQTSVIVLSTQKWSDILTVLYLDIEKIISRGLIYNINKG